MAQRRKDKNFTKKSFASLRLCDFALKIKRMELTELQTKYEEIKEKVTQLGRFL